MAEQWFVVRTKQARETTAACAIAAEGFHAFLPVTLVERSHAGKRERVSRPLFNRYLFVQFDRTRDPFGKLNFCRGVASHNGLMCDSRGIPIPVPDRVIDAIRDRENAMKARAGEITTGYRPGDVFRIQVGKWAQFDATYVGEEKDKVWASISLFGMAHVITLPFSAVPLYQKPIDRISA